MLSSSTLTHRHRQRSQSVILNLIEDPWTSSFESLRNASELRQTSGVDNKGIRFAHTGSPIGVGDDEV